MRVIYDDVVELAEVAIRCKKTAEKGKCIWCPFYDRCKIDEFENRHILCAEIEQPKQPSGMFLNCADVAQVRHGRWVYARTYHKADECHCSLCGQLMTTAIGERMNYCPNCGAHMDLHDECEQEVER